MKKVHRNFRLTEAEWEHMTRQSVRYGVSVSEYIRRLIEADMGKPMPERTQEEFLAHKELVYEINRIGNNINQIVKNVNMHYYTEYEKKKLFALMKKLMELLEEKDI